MLLPYPLIPERRDSGARPYWSVMIPTYNPRADYPEETLHSVLQQDPGPEQMQIEVIDGRSTDDLAPQTLGPGRWRRSSGNADRARGHHAAARRWHVLFRMERTFADVI